MCKERPIACRTNATFILDTSSLEQRDEYKADDNGSFRHHGKNIEFVELNDEGDVVKLHIKPAMLKEASTSYHVHIGCTDLTLRSREEFSSFKTAAETFPHSLCFSMYLMEIQAVSK